MASIAEIYSLPESQARDLPRCSDQQLISLLRSRYRSPERKTVLLDLDDLEHVPVTERAEHWCFIGAFEAGKTSHGTWSPKKMVSIPNTSQGNSSNFPNFVGTKTTMEFKPTGVTHPFFGMMRYNILTTREDGNGLYLDEELSLCHTYPLQGKGKGTRNRNGKRSRSEYVFDPLDGITPAELEELERSIDSTHHPPLAVVDSSVNVQDLLFAEHSKSEPSKFWQSFTKIYTKDPKRMYAACNHCDTMLKLKGGPSCGTGSLKHHNDSCRCKTKKEQLPGNSSTVPLPSIALQAIAEQLELV